MRTVWLPVDDWARDLFVPSHVQVEVWRSGRALPSSPDAVEFYVPEYLGPAEVIEVMQSMKSLKVVQTLTAGYEHLIGHVPDDVALCNARGVHEASTAELAVGFMIASLRGFPDFVRAQDQGKWLHQKREALADKRVLILGYGSVGQAVAERLTPFEVELIPVAHHARQGVHAVTELGTLLPSADIVVVTVPLTPGTSHLVDGEFLSQLADGALLVNVARGQVVDTQALVAELGRGRIRAALDVTDPEPLPPEHPLWSSPNVLISPHVGGNTSAFAPRAWRLVRDQVMRYYADEPLRNVVIEPHC